MKTPPAVQLRRSVGRLAATSSVAMVFVTACSTQNLPTTPLVEGPDRPVLGVCQVLGSMQECAEILTAIYLETDDAYDGLSSHAEEQSATYRRMQEGAEFYSQECRVLGVRAGAEVNITNGCDDALGKIVDAHELMTRDE